MTPEVDKPGLRQTVPCDRSLVFNAGNRSRRTAELPFKSINTGLRFGEGNEILAPLAALFGIDVHTLIPAFNKPFFCLSKAIK